MNLRFVAAESVLEVLASVSLVLLGAGATGAAFGRAIGFVLGALIGLIMIYRLVGAPPLRLHRMPGRANLRRVARYAGALVVVETAYTLSASVSVLMLGAYAGSAASGMYQAPMRLILLLGYVGLSAANGVAPRIARQEGREPDVRALHAALRGLIGFQCLLLAPAVVWSEPVTHLLLGEEYGEAAAVLAALAPFIFFSGLAPILSISINYLGEARRRVPIALGTVVLVFASAFALIPPHGPVGAAIATDIGYGFYTLAHLWLCWRLLQLPHWFSRWEYRSLAASSQRPGWRSCWRRSVRMSLHQPSGSSAEPAASPRTFSILLLTRELRISDVARAATAVRTRMPSAPEPHRGSSTNRASRPCCQRRRSPGLAPPPRSPSTPPPTFTRSLGDA